MDNDEHQIEDQDNQEHRESKHPWMEWFEKGLWVFLFLVGVLISAGIAFGIFYFAT